MTPRFMIHIKIADAQNPGRTLETCVRSNDLKDAYKDAFVGLAHAVGQAYTTEQWDTKIKEEL